MLIAFPFAALWALLYSPIALIAAAISQSFFATLNPITGIDAIRRMGSIYWEAWFIYTGIVIVGGLAASILGIVPLLGTLLGRLRRGVLLPLLRLPLWASPSSRGPKSWGSTRY